MAITKGEALPNASLLRIGAEGPEAVDLASLIADKKVVIFGLPGAYTRTCTAAHMPSFVNSADALRAKGVVEIICVTVNDPFVTGSWAKDTGADSAGIHVLADADAGFIKSIGMNFTAPPVGFYDRSMRFAMIVENGEVTHVDVEENAGVCTVSAGNAILDLL